MVMIFDILGPKNLTYTVLYISSLWMVTRDFYNGKGLKKYATGKFMNPQKWNWATKY